MFNGIIKNTGKIYKVYKKNNNCSIEILSKMKFSKNEIGTSSSCSGTCLTLEKSNKNLTYEEGCLSVPGQFAAIDRPDKCHIKYLDYYGQTKEIKAEGMLATCIQHEIDHLEGILFIDYLSKLKKTMIIKKLSKQKKEIERIVV